MAWKKSKNQSKSKSTYMYPYLHDAVSNKVINDIGATQFHYQNTDKNVDNKYQTNIMGRFKCSNDSCPTDGWGSKKVAILIRGYTGGGYNAVVFNQRCRSCNSLGALTLNEDSYAERVADRLKIWAGITMKRPPYSGREGPPHRRDLCEGCKLGYCRGDSASGTIS